ncbi:cytochrome P450 [Mesorhizobium cantuariense]|uniref:Cytochrome P450 n=1 Tax=Mesorhizobium cantuariense TaxID=1300275 RepID=A0ABV7MR50_9HYPH
MIDPDFNPMTSDAFRRNPYPILARVRESHPVAYLCPGLVESWSVLRYEDAQRVLLDPNTFSSDRGLHTGGEFGEANLAFLFNNMISASGEKHRRLRLIGNRVFMPKYLERFRPVVETAVRERMAMALQGEAFDLVEDFAAPITVTMICAILGIPRDEMEQIRRWTAVLADNSGASTWLPILEPAMVDRGRRTGEEMAAYFRTYLEERRRRPMEGDLISDFLSV